MDASRFDAVAKLFADRRLSRRNAVGRAGAGLVATLAAASLGRSAGAQEATPGDPAGSPAAGADEKIPYLFLQAFKSGRVAPKEGAEGRFTLTLEQGLGHTIYFSDRPSRDVGATPTPQFLENLGFPPDNPPNAALVVETAAGETEIAVVELFEPSYEEATRTATYEVAVLAEWERGGEGNFTETAADLSAFGSEFGAAHLFIDDCADATVYCTTSAGHRIGDFGSQGFCWNYARCVPCHPYGHTNPYNGAAWDWWKAHCNEQFSACNNACVATDIRPSF